MACKFDFEFSEELFNLDDDAPYNFNGEDEKKSFQRRVLWHVYLRTLREDPAIKAIIAEPLRKGQQDSRAMYRAIVFEFNRPSVLGALELCNKLLSLKLDDCEPHTVRSFYAELQRLNELMKHRGCVIPDLILMARFVKGLPDTFQPFKNTLAALKCKALEEVYHEAKEYAAQNNLEQQRRGEGQQQVFHMQQQQRKRKEQKECTYYPLGTCKFGDKCRFIHKTKFKGKCHNCGEEGHMKKDCKKQERKDKQRQAYMITAADSDDSDETQGMFMLRKYDILEGSDDDRETCPLNTEEHKGQRQHNSSQGETRTLASLPPPGELGCCQENPYPPTYSQVGPQEYNIDRENNVCSYGMRGEFCNFFPCEMHGTSKLKMVPPGVQGNGLRFTQQSERANSTQQNECEKFNNMGQKYINARIFEKCALLAKKGLDTLQSVVVLDSGTNKRCEREKEPHPRHNYYSELQNPY